MICELDYCIYNRDLLCILKEIQINPLGLCSECILVSVSDDHLKLLKEKQLNDIESRWDTKELLKNNMDILRSIFRYTASEKTLRTYGYARLLLPCLTKNILAKFVHFIYYHLLSNLKSFELIRKWHCFYKF